MTTTQFLLFFAGLTSLVWVGTWLLERGLRDARQRELLESELRRQEIDDTIARVFRKRGL